MVCEETQQKIRIGLLSSAVIASWASVLMSCADTNKDNRPTPSGTNLVQKVEVVKPKLTKNLSPTKVLNVSLRDYLENQGKNIGDYDFVGVDGLSIPAPVNRYIGEDVPLNTEVIVNYQPLYSYPWGTGIALIPREKAK